jgi:RimJ/RimL family protein N-acetyltransferase
MIELKPFNKNDFQRLINWSSTEVILIQFAGPIFKFPLTIEQLENYVNARDRLPFKVIDSKTQDIIGHAEILSTCDSKTLKICRILIGDESKRGKGFGQKIIEELLKICFIDKKMNTVELNVFNWNTGAIMCYEKIGFKINPSKSFKSEVDGNIWTALNMIIEIREWKNEINTPNIELS